MTTNQLFKQKNRKQHDRFVEAISGLGILYFYNNNNIPYVVSSERLGRRKVNCGMDKMLDFIDEKSSCF